MDIASAAELRTDVKTLLECLKCQQDNPTACRQALLTISSIFATNNSTKEYFQECGGLEYILNLIMSTTFLQIKESALYCVGCCVDGNVTLQKKVTTIDVFSNLYNLLSSSTSNDRLRQTTTFLILSIVANNSYGQVLAMRSGCLQALMQIFRSCLLSEQTLELTEDTPALKLWSSVVSVLSMCVNNPQNDDNQRLCATLLPYTFKLLQECQLEKVIRPLAAFLGLLVANNVYNQDRVRKCGGLEIIISAIQRLDSQSRRYPQAICMALQLVNTLDSCVADNAGCVETAGEHEAVETLLSLLSLPELDEPSQLQIILTLGHITDISGSNQKKLIESGGLPLLIHRMAQSEDEDVHKAVKYVLQSVHGVDGFDDETAATIQVQAAKGPHCFEHPDLLQSVENFPTTKTSCHVTHPNREEENNTVRLNNKYIEALSAVLNRTSGKRQQEYMAETGDCRRNQIIPVVSKKTQENCCISIQRPGSEYQRLVLRDVIGERSPCSSDSEETLPFNSSKTKNFGLNKSAKVQLNTSQKNSTAVAENQWEKEQLKAQLNKEKEKRELIEKEALQLREKIDRQKEKEQKANALMEELEKQEREAMVSSSSQDREKETVKNSDKVDVFVKPEPPRVSARRVTTRASQKCRPSFIPASVTTTGRSGHPSKTVVSSVKRSGLDLNDSCVSDTQSEFDFRLLTTAKPSTYGLRSATPQRPFSRHQHLVTSTPLYGTGNSIFHNEFGDVPSVKPVRRAPKDFIPTSQSCRGGPVDGDITQETDISDDDDIISCGSPTSAYAVHCVRFCPGCCPPQSCGMPLLNSRTYNIVLETNSNTCPAHRQVRKIERMFMRQRNKEHCQHERLHGKGRPLRALSGQRFLGRTEGVKPSRHSPAVYDFISEDEGSENREVTPPYSGDTYCPTGTLQPTLLGKKFRRPRIPYTEEETENLLRGVNTLGKHWNQILVTYPFHSCRTAVDLMEKYKRMMGSEKLNASCLNTQPSGRGACGFSLCEERRLKRGVKQFGYNWKLILAEFRFTKGRTPEELRSKWRNMHRKKLSIL